jgi:hypothetical protein
MWNGPLECRLFRFDMVSGRLVKDAASGQAGHDAANGSELGADAGVTGAAP